MLTEDVSTVQEHKRASFPRNERPLFRKLSMTVRLESEGRCHICKVDVTCEEKMS